MIVYLLLGCGFVIGLVLGFILGLAASGVWSR